MTLIKEDGTGRADANCYALVADCDAYHEGHLYATAWSGAPEVLRETALVMATRLIDAQFQFNGFKRRAEQALQWPRRECPAPDVERELMPEDAVPAIVMAASCELARELLKQDRTDDPDGEGLKALRIEGALSLEFDAKDRQPAIPRLVQVMLAKVGEYRGEVTGMARLIRC